uniref:Uncharacterized protein n=1 Tax=Anguilla anguilla TaxID=7936 RepID=A0A0E9VG82_ANGAN
MFCWGRDIEFFVINLHMLLHISPQFWGWVTLQAFGRRS